MALTQGLIPFEDSFFCLLMDAEADSIEIVHPDGFELQAGEDVVGVGAEGGARIDFYPSFYDERPVPGEWQAIMVRHLDGSNAPVGLMVENVSKRFRPRWRRAVPTIPEVVEMLLILGYQHLGAERTEPIFEDAPDPPVMSWPTGLPELKLNGERGLVG